MCLEGHLYFLYEGLCCLWWYSTAKSNLTFLSHFHCTSLEVGGAYAKLPLLLRVTLKVNNIPAQHSCTTFLHTIHMAFYGTSTPIVLRPSQLNNLIIIQFFQQILFLFFILILTNMHMLLRLNNK